MKMRKVLACLLSMALCAGMLAGCSGGTGESESNAGAGTEAAAESGGAEETASNLNAEGFPIVNEPITLTVYGQRDQNQAEWEEMYVFFFFE